MKAKRRAWIGWGLVLALGAGACSDGDPREGEASKASPAQAARVEVERGPVHIELAMVPAEPRLSDEPELTLTLDADARVEVDPPNLGDQLAGFVVRSFHQAGDEVKDGRRVRRQVYRLEPLETGEQTLPPVRVTFRDTRPEGDGAEHVAETEPLVVTVRSMLEGAAPSLDMVRGPIAPQEIEIVRPWPWTATWIAAGAVVAALAAWLLLRRRRRRAGPVHVLTPSEQAQQELERLLQDDPLGRGELNTFFVELTLVVRRYIERTTGVRAPEQTTAEFLRAMRSHAAFDADTRARLKAFLESADLVKFAAHAPARADIEENFRLAQEFVGLPGNLALGRGQGEAA